MRHLLVVLSACAPLLGGAVTATLFSGAGPGFSGTCAGLPQNITVLTRR